MYFAKIMKNEDSAKCFGGNMLYLTENFVPLTRIMIEKLDFTPQEKEETLALYNQIRQEITSSLKESDEEKKEDDSEHPSSDEERTLPTFVKGESGDHKPTLTEKWTTPPPYYNEASLLRAMETAGKFVEDETLRAAMKENGIGRPSSRAGIIETLFKRHYIKRDRKRLIATPTGIELIDLIREELLKSCELTGIWEKKLRDIEHQKYDAQQFIEELKAQVAEIVSEVMSDSSNRRVTVLTDADLKKVKSKTKKITEGQPCPLCGQGHIIKGKTAYGCSRWKEGCTWRQPLQQK